MFKKILFVIVILLIVSVVPYTVYGLYKPLPDGVSYEGDIHHVSNVEFIADLSYEKDGERVRDHQIFDKVIEMVEEAEEFIVFDMFLFNDKYDEDKDYPEITDRITKALIKKKEESPELEITFITDEINTTYRSHPSKHLRALEENDVDVILTNLTPLRDANPIYSGFWRAFLSVFGREGEGWIENPFSENAPKVTVGSYLKMLNLKGNHRKVMTTDKRAMITSANPHDASGYNSNIAFVVEGNIIEDILQSEQAVANFSGGKQLPHYQDSSSESGDINIQLLTEGKTREHLLKEINQTDSGDRIYIGMFNLADSGVVKQLVAAAERGVDVRMILDPNETFFGNENIGIPNRPVAYDLEEYGNGNLHVKWYNTEDEQYHSKIILIERDEMSTIIGGSANFTRRNLDDFNLDTSLKVEAHNKTEIVKEVSHYFQKLWNNDEAIYTVSVDEYLEDFSEYKKYLFRLQKKTGLTTF
ncbi:phospholipase D family protein [Alkalihalobacillus sp. MEB130]|uniref:phospholipase D family protein n=1 Tax=Alkalihalobacillus sp. MEB130 TaxID=2976704 RepID=UPI0028DF473E|nr:phospholipase D family protein [Alkalihalobacillus sp. MEB130]MDT8861049.1 phospholipase D family protein [Alkalihalobacillus sp. MEB130]